MHLTLGILRKSQAVFYALAFFWLDGFAVPAPAQVTQTVRRQEQVYKANMTYDIPYEAQPKNGLHSNAYHKFYENFFIDATGLIRREVDLGFIGELSSHETELAKDLIRRNLKLRYVHIIEGVTVLQDHELVAQLSDMFSHESNFSRKLTIAGTLWKLEKDPVFPECLQKMAKSDDDTLKAAHIHQITWLGDERSVNLLIDILESGIGFAQHLSLSILNAIENKKFYLGLDFPHSKKYYISHKRDAAFMDKMVKNLIEWYNKIAA